MPTNPSDDVGDDERTDELPVLVETVVLGSTQPAGADSDSVEDTAERTAQFRSPAGGSTAEIASLQTDLAARGAKIAALEEDIARLSARWNEIERHLTSRDERIEVLNGTLAELRKTLAERHVAEQRLTTELAQRGSDIERLGAENTALRAAAATAEANLAALAAESKAAMQRPAGGPSEDALQNEIASLRAYIANRNDWWRELKSQAAAAADRITALQREIGDVRAAHRDASALAARETERAASLRTELVAATRIVEEQRRELAVAREANAGPPARPAAEAAPPPAPSPESAANPAAPAPPTLASIEQTLTAAPAAPVAAAPGPLPAPAFEVLAALEAEVAHKRQQIAAQLVELREREQKLQTGATTIERLREEVASLRTELEQRRTDVSRLERAVVDKDRALAARDLRIATLQEELNQRLGAIQKLNAMDLSLQGLSSKMSDRLRRADPAPESTNVPTLVCLTGDAPKELPLNKKTILIGRGHHCDVQIVTHVVSREHARITVERGTVVIEDLASTNGVFVNAVRVERQELHHGDLLTIGETQFRFLESMAH